MGFTWSFSSERSLVVLDRRRCSVMFGLVNALPLSANKRCLSCEENSSGEGHSEDSVLLLSLERAKKLLVFDLCTYSSHISGLPNVINLPLVQWNMDDRKNLIVHTRWFYLMEFRDYRGSSWFNHNVCFIKFRSKHSTVLLLCLLRNLMEQTLHSRYVVQIQVHSHFYLTLASGSRSNWTGIWTGK